DPALARFLRPDPVRQGGSPYPYVGNDPVNFIDPTGEVRTIKWTYHMPVYKRGRLRATRQVFLDNNFIPMFVADVTPKKERHWQKYNRRNMEDILFEVRGGVIGTSAEEVKIGRIRQINLPYNRITQDVITHMHATYAGAPLMARSREHG